MPLRARVQHGAERGALFGVYFFVLLWLGSVLGERRIDHVVQQPVTAAAWVIGGFALTGAALFVLGPRVRNLLGAVGLAIICLVPMMFGMSAAVAGFAGFINPAVVVLSIVTGVIIGTISWKRWGR